MADCVSSDDYLSAFFIYFISFFLAVLQKEDQRWGAVVRTYYIVHTVVLKQLNTKLSDRIALHRAWDPHWNFIHLELLDELVFPRRRTNEDINGVPYLLFQYVWRRLAQRVFRCNLLFDWNCSSSTDANIKTTETHENAPGQKFLLLLSQVGFNRFAISRSNSVSNTSIQGNNLIFHAFAVKGRTALFDKSRNLNKMSQITHPTVSKFAPINQMSFTFKLFFPFKLKFFFSSM